LLQRNTTLILFFLSFNINAQLNISVSDAWIATAPPTVSTHAGYLIISNNGQDKVTLISINSPDFSKIEIHKTVTENGISSMDMFDNIQIPANDQLILKPGDFHLMLYNAYNLLKTDSIVSLILEFSDNTKLETTAQVRNMTDLFQQVPDDKSASSKSDSFAGLKVSYQKLLPQHFLSNLMYKVTRFTWAPFKDLIIQSFIKFYDVDMSIAKQSDPGEYNSFNAFFTRQLNSTARPIDNSIQSIISPVDGSVSQYGRINADKLLQAKGKNYTLVSLLGGDQALAAKFTDGDFITLYLSPKDYHRIHMPMNGELQSMIYIPGKLFSVSPGTTQGIDNLFARNERVINLFKTNIGNVALIMVGAIFVGSMETVWAGEITPKDIRKKTIQHYSETDKKIRLPKGTEAGRFNMGSTVILLFEKGKLNWNKNIAVDSKINMGQIIAEIQNGQDLPD
jgi:phosphatidylserine decarboxylase